ncbi:MAG: 50S ribosomal protein L24 [Oscillospiraceae bacterium]|jgi:large subunit ribosomal protein L24|nr:50S ribosomal protein L24 [Oscillospiraceae bacterium]
MSKLHVKTGDRVLIISGKNKGKEGKVLAASPKEGKIIVEGRNMVTKHIKPRKAGDQGGIVKAESAIYACKVQVICPACKKQTRVAHKVLEDGTKIRLCAKCKESL